VPRDHDALAVLANEGSDLATLRDDTDLDVFCGEGALVREQQSLEETIGRLHLVDRCGQGRPLEFVDRGHWPDLLKSGRGDLTSPR
jgi:hypothetical protein